jgi:hypothetical protein
VNVVEGRNNGILDNLLVGASNLASIGIVKGDGESVVEALHAIGMGRKDTRRESQEGGNDGNKGKHGKLLVLLVARKNCVLNLDQN